MRSDAATASEQLCGRERRAAERGERAHHACAQRWRGRRRVLRGGGVGRVCQGGHGVCVCVCVCAGPGSYGTRIVSWCRSIDKVRMWGRTQQGGRARVCVARGRVRVACAWQCSGNGAELMADTRGPRRVGPGGVVCAARPVPSDATHSSRVRCRVETGFAIYSQSDVCASVHRGPLRDIDKRERRYMAVCVRPNS